MVFFQKIIYCNGYIINSVLGLTFTSVADYSELFFVSEIHYNRLESMRARFGIVDGSKFVVYCKSSVSYYIYLATGTEILPDRPFNRKMIAWTFNQTLKKYD